MPAITALWKQRQVDPEDTVQPASSTFCLRKWCGTWRMTYRVVLWPSHAPAYVWPTPPHTQRAADSQLQLCQFACVSLLAASPLLHYTHSWCSLCSRAELQQWPLFCILGLKVAWNQLVFKQNFPPDNTEMLQALWSLSIYQSASWQTQETVLAHPPPWLLSFFPSGHSF